ncbi:MAG: pacearchaeosortase [Candidatus Pacearchaeota archaeon]
MKKEDKKQFVDIVTRYLFLLLVGLPNLFLFYFLFSPLTIYPVYFFLRIFFDVSLYGNILYFPNFPPVQIINACIAGAAYYLLLILNLSTPKIKIEKRIKMIFYSFISFLLLNVFRIFILVLLLNSNFAFFDLTHKLFWYFLSTIFVVGIWFFQVKIYKIKEIPFYSDLKYIYKKSYLN